MENAFLPEISPQLKFIFGTISGILAFVFYVVILRAEIKGTWEPNPTSWFIWALNDTLIFFASFSAGASNTLTVPIVYAICSWVILALALRNKLEKLKLIESLCLFLSALSWLVYFMLVGMRTALILGVVVNTIGAIPSITRLWKNPKAELLFPWSCLLVASVLSILSLEKFTLDLALFPFGSFALNFTITALILRKFTSNSKLVF